jgi:hypothetical protein
MGISCGLPNEMGDIPPELMAVPGVLTMGLNVTFVRAMGDSMIGVNIHDGDLLMVESTRTIVQNMIEEQVQASSTRLLTRLNVRESFLLM